MSEHQHELQRTWFKKWYNHIHGMKINDKSRDFQVIALALTTNPDASIMNCMNVVLDLIPLLRQHFTILKTNEKENFCCKLEKYSFQTPKNPVKLSPSRIQKPKAENRTNCYASLDKQDQELTETTINDEILFLNYQYQKNSHPIILYSNNILHQPFQKIQNSIQIFKQVCQWKQKKW